MVLSIEHLGCHAKKVLTSCTEPAYQFIYDNFLSVERQVLIVFLL